MKKWVLFSIFLGALPSGAMATEHFSLGIGHYNNDAFYYTDKAYFDGFSMDLGAYSDLNSSHFLYLDAHLYSTASQSVFAPALVLYSGIGGVVMSANAFRDFHGSKEQVWGLRLPIGAEVLLDSGMSFFAEVVPTLFFASQQEYETTAALGVRFYLY